MSSKTSEVTVASVTLKDIYHAVISPSSSSADPPMEEWSSLFDVAIPESPKMVRYKQGLYDPGSGEICAKYLPMSDSDVLRHVYYNYPGIKDPGIMEALSKPEKRKVYNTNGQELYLDLCEEMNLVPVRSFHRGLMLQVIDLRFYGVNPIGVRAMCLALALNSTVQHLNLSSNFLSEDACYHLGQLLGENHCLRELVLTGCKIKPDGLRRLVIRLARRTMDLLDLSKNDLGDEGFELLAAQILKGAVIKRLSLSNNNLGEESAHAFVAAIEGNKTCTHLDLSWNKLYPPKGANDLLKQLGDSKVLTELYLSWNALTVGLHLRKLITVPTLRLLDLSYNRLSSAAAKAICSRLHLAPALRTLNLSHNPLTPADALLLLQKLGEKEVALQNLLMDDVIVSKEFAPTLKEVLSLNYRTQSKVTHGKVLRDYTLSVPDLREIVMRRLHFLTESTRKCTMDMPLFFLKEYKERETMMPRELVRALKVAGGPIDEGLIDELTRLFQGPKAEKGGNTIQLQKVVEFIRRLWPEKQLPPTPPPTPPIAAVKKEKGKKKKK